MISSKQGELKFKEFFIFYLNLAPVYHLVASLKLVLYYELNWPKRASAVYWLLGTLLYPWPGVNFHDFFGSNSAQIAS